MLYKDSGPGAVKLLAEEGAFVATIATLNVIDHDGDVTLPGAFGSAQDVRICQWGHEQARPPAGKGTVREEGDKAKCYGRFFLETQAGREHYETVKSLGGLTEWSYGYQILDSSPGEFQGRRVRFLKRLHVIEVSPVLRGAGIGTRTDAIKAARRADLPVAVRQLLPSGRELRQQLAELMDECALLSPVAMKQRVAELAAAEPAPPPP